MWFLMMILLLISATVISAHYMDPSDYFSGAQHRPKLEIVNPENGQILDNGDLEIKIKVDGYEMPSKLHNSTICVGLSTGVNFAEQCFEQTAELVFQANGLSPGSQYALRIVLYERGHAIAVSVRNFKVAGIRGLLNSDEIVTIQTAVQVAMEYQMMGMEAQAELIYRSILSENPAYPDALHLLGVIFYQKGDVQTAIPYIERALQSNKSFEGFHNSLGVCYRTLGKNDEAEKQFKLAIALNPQYMSAVFNLGLTYQQMNQWDAAIAHYHQVNEYSKVHADAVKPQVRLESKIRECDLIQGQQRVLEALDCWEDGIELFPNDGVIRNEIGSMYARAEMYDAASAHLRVAIEQGYFLAEINLARVREIQGYTEEARMGFQNALQYALDNDLPSFHIKVCLTTVHPKVISGVEEVLSLRSALDVNLNTLLELGHTVVDNTAPTSFGFSTGYQWLYHQTDTSAAGAASGSSSGITNVLLKTKLYRVYRVMCPALLQGYFIDSMDAAWIDSNAVAVLEEQEETYLSSQEQTEGAVDVSVKGTASAPTAAMLGAGTVTAESGGAVSATTAAAVASAASTSADGLRNKSPPSKGESAGGGQSAVNGTDSTISTATVVKSAASTSASAAASSKSQSGRDSASEDDSIIQGLLPRSSPSKLRIGFASRFLYSHPVGVLVQGLVSVLSSDPAAVQEVEVVAFFIGGGEGSSQYDAVQARIAQGSMAVYNLPVDDIATCASAIRLANLDVLIYPEIGIDLATYFLSFARLAPVQAAWLGHPDTTGVQSVDYFLTSDVELPDAESRYSEQLYRLPGFGTKFVDETLQAVTLQRNAPRTVLLNRAKLTEDFHIPKSAHLYVVVQSVSKLHYTFDDAIRSILSLDRLGYILIVNEQPMLPHWKQLFLARLTSKKHITDLEDRVLFYSPTSRGDLLNVLLVSHVMLDPFPVNENYHILLQALSVGLPVVTMPSDVLGGRFALALYRMLDYGFASSPNAMYSETSGGDGNGSASSGDSSTAALIVESMQEYTTMALRLTHQPKLRAHHSNNILNNREHLFATNGTRVWEMWRTFMKTALHNRTITLE